MTQNAVAILLYNKNNILKFTKFSHCADEVYKQTFLASHSELSIINNDLRLIDWSRSVNGCNPHIFTSEDRDMLINSDKLFARKFDVNTDRAIIDELYQYIKDKS